MLSRPHLLRRCTFTLFAVLLICGLTLSLAQPTAAVGANLLPYPSPVYKSASKAMLSLGETMTYAIHLETPWNASIPVEVTDPLPAGLDYVPGTANLGGVYDPATRTVSWTGITVNPGVPVDLKFDVKDVLAVNFPTPRANTASIDLNGLVLMRTAWVLLMPAAPPPTGLDGSFKSASPSRLGLGEVVTYTIHLLDNRLTPVTIQVTDPVPASLTYVDGSADNGGVYDPVTRTIVWSSIAAPPGQPFLLTFQAKAPKAFINNLPLLVRNTAAITSGGILIKRSADILIVPQPGSPLEGSFKTASQRAVAPGQRFTYTIYLHNSSDTPVPAAVSDALPAQVTYVDGSANAGGVYDAAARTLTWSDLSIPEGGSLNLTFDVVATPLSAVTPIPILNTAVITSGSITLQRSVRVMLVPKPVGDVIPPRVDSFTIGSQDVLTGPDVTLHIAASDNVKVTQMLLKEWVLSAALPGPHWQEVKSSGWIPYQADLPWTLSAQSGTHFMGVWVADAAMNRSHLTRKAVDFASLLLPNTAVGQGGMIPYLVYYPAGVDVTATLNTLTGTASLFVWYPGNRFAPDQPSPAAVTPSATITFTTPFAGLYLFLVRGETAATFDLSITPAGGPRPGPALAEATQAAFTTDLAALDSPMTFDPILPESGLDPLNVAVDPVGPFFQTFLPVITK